MLHLSTSDGVSPGLQGTVSKPLSGNWVRKLQRFVASQVERCELCGARIPSEHAHLLDLSSRRAVCACRSCAIVAGGLSDGPFRSVPSRSQALGDFRMTDAQWAALQIPIGMAFLFHATPEGRPVALYPGPAGATESLLSPEAWATIVECNPTLADMAPDVEALLVNRTRGRREYFRVSIDHCFVVTALIRTHWRGLSGGDKVWEVIDQFFAGLNEPNVASRRWVHG